MNLKLNLLSSKKSIRGVDIIIHPRSLLKKGRGWGLGGALGGNHGNYYLFQQSKVLPQKICLTAF